MDDNQVVNSRKTARFTRLRWLNEAPFSTAGAAGPAGAYIMLLDVLESDRFHELIIDNVGDAKELVRLATDYLLAYAETTSGYNYELSEVKPTGSLDSEGAKIQIEGPNDRLPGGRMWGRTRWLPVSKAKMRAIAAILAN